MGRGRSDEAIGYAVLLVIAIFVGGCFCIGFGAFKMWKTNTRAADVQAYNTEAALFDGSEVKSLWGNTTGVVLEPLGMPLVISTQRVVVQGNTDGVNTVRHVTWSLLGVPFSAIEAGTTPITTFWLRYTYGGVNRTTAPLTAMLPVSPNRRPGPIQCPADEPSGKCNAASVCTAPPYFGVNYTGPSDCPKDEACGTCWYIQYQSSICLVLNWSTSVTGGWEEAGMQLNRCEFPFNANVSVGPNRFAGSSQSMFDVRFLPVGDPVLSLRRITRGSEDFGDSYLKQKATGLALFVLGWFLVMVICGPIIHIGCCRDKDICEAWCCCCSTDCLCCCCNLVGNLTRSRPSHVEAIDLGHPEMMEVKTLTASDTL